MPKANTLYTPEDWVGYASSENRNYFKIRGEFFLAPYILIQSAFQERSRASSYSGDIRGSKNLQTISITFDVYVTEQPFS